MKTLLSHFEKPASIMNKEALFLLCDCFEAQHMKSSTQIITELKGGQEKEEKQLIEKEFALAISRLQMKTRLRKITELLEICSGEIEKKKEQEALTLKEQIDSFDKDYLNDPKITRYINPENLWTLVTDVRDHGFGRESYDEGTNTSQTAEPGYIDAAETAMAFIFKTKGTKLTVDYYHKLHFLFCCDVLGNEIDAPIATLNDQRIRPTGIFAVSSALITRAGLEEKAAWIESSKVFNPLIVDDISLHSNNIDEFLAALNKEGVARASRNKKRDHALTQFIQEYEETIAKHPNNDEVRLAAIATLTNKIEFFHPDIDGNLRTVEGLAKKLLLDADLPLSCSDNPNKRDGRSSKEQAEAMKVGMHYYEDYLLPISASLNFSHVNADSKNTDYPFQSDIVENPVYSAKLLRQLAVQKENLLQQAQAKVELDELIPVVEAIAEKGDRQAQLEAGEYYAFLGDMKKAEYWFEKNELKNTMQNFTKIMAEAELGNKEAQYKMGCYYNDCENNTEEAKKWFRKAGVMRKIVTQDYRLSDTEKNQACDRAIKLLATKEQAKEKEAVMIFRKLGKGFGPGQFELGRCYQEGIGVERDEKKAFDLFLNAFNLNHPLAGEKILALKKLRDNVKQTKVDAPLNTPKKG